MVSRVRVSFPVTERTNFRLSYSHQVQSPDFQYVLSGINNDLAITNTNDTFGRDVTFGKSILFEFGIRHAFTQDLVFDISAYNKDKLSTWRTGRSVRGPGPRRHDADQRRDQPGLRKRARPGPEPHDPRRHVFNGQLGYTFQLANSTGSDPDSYLKHAGPSTTAVLGERSDRRSPSFPLTTTGRTPSSVRCPSRSRTTSRRAR